MSVWFRLLGELEVLVDGRAVDIGRLKQRAVLTALLVDANRVVSVDALIDRVWGDDLPQRPREALYSYLSRLRAALAGTDEVAITSRSGGYVITVDRAAVDLHRFQDLVSQGAVAEALDLWHGQPFEGLDTPWIVELRDTLNRQRLAARLDLHDMRLRAGDHNGLVTELTALAAANPLDERLAGQLMLALYRGGQQAEALAAYQRIRHGLVTQLGVDPGPELRKVHQEVLTGDAALPRPVAAVRAPRQLIGAPRWFAGRGDELERVNKLLDRGEMTVVAISGPGGVGKTWLALHWAHRNADRFPDGQLFVNLRGFDPLGRPMAVETAVRGFLDALGADSTPDGLEAQTALYRSLVAGRKILIVLDNAVDVAQVAPLLPGSDSCTVVVTSRDRLAGLVTAHGADALQLDMLSEADARALLTARLGAERLAAEPSAVEELLAYCAGLPLALSIVAGRAQSYPEFPLSALSVELRDAGTRLGALDEADAVASVRAVLSLSFAALDPRSARVFGLLGAAPGPDISLPAVANLVGLEIAEARTVLRGLEQVSLVQQHAAGRYRMHDLVRLYAAEQADGSLRGLVDFYLHTAVAGDRLLNPHRRPVEVPPAVPGCRPLAFGDQAEAMAWFNAEHAGLLATQRYAADQGWHRVVIGLTWALTSFFRRRGYLADAIGACRAALAAAEAVGDPALHANVEQWLGHAYERANALPEALEHFHRALELGEQAGDLHVQDHTHHSLAQVYERRGEYERGLEHAQRALAMSRALGSSAVAEARSLTAVGWFWGLLGNHGEARAACEAALELFRRHHNREGEAAALDSLGFIANQSGRRRQALAHYEEALALLRDLGDAYHEAETLDRIGQTVLALGDRERALAYLRRARDMCLDQGRDEDAARIRRQIDSLAALA